METARAPEGAPARTKPPTEFALQRAASVEAPELEMTLDEMLRTSDVIIDDDAIYLPPFYFSETGCAKRLIRLMKGERRVLLDVEKVMREIESDSRICYDEIQLQAIREAIYVV
ncbi:MAG: hypothetical protein LIP10_10175 [Clostridiales bacterium]|nr:hypothetical protein [Clostridiales bacterium]